MASVAAFARLPNRCVTLARIFNLKGGNYMNRFLIFVLGFIAIQLTWIMKDTLSISTEIKEIRATITQQAKECHNLDTMEVKK